MFLFFLPIIVVVASQIIYDVSAKSVDEELNAYAGTTIIYTILAASYFIIYIVFTKNASIGAEFAHINWAVAMLAIGSIGLESGYIFLYRAGWNISLGGMVCNIILAVCMLGVGFLVYHETISVIQVIGIALCFTGLIFVFKGGNNRRITAKKELEN